MHLIYQSFILYGSFNYSSPKLKEGFGVSIPQLFLFPTLFFDLNMVRKVGVEPTLYGF